MKVIATTLIINPNTGSALKSNIFALRKAASRTIAMLMVLFATRTVLRSFSGFPYSLSITLDLLSLIGLKIVKILRPERKVSDFCCRH